MTARPSLRSARRLSPVAACAVLALCACTANPGTGAAGGAASDGGAAAAGPIPVSITDTNCEVSAASAPSGVVSFEVTNNGTVPNEFEVLAGDKLRIISEQENIGPGTTVTLTAALPEGEYYTACKPNMVGAFVGDAAFTALPSDAPAVDESTQELEAAAVTNYTAYVRDQVGTLVTETKAFTDAYTSGDLELARALFPQARSYYERIEPTAEAFGIEEAGDLDAALDLRIQDVAADAGSSVTDPAVLETWTGWHRIEADLFSEPGSPFSFPDAASRQAAADRLNADTQTLYDLVYGNVEGASGPFELTLNDVVNGAQGLMDEVANSKIAGEEDTFSHTDLADFQANLDGARVAYGNVQPIVQAKDPQLDAQITERFDAVQAQLDTHVSGTRPDGAPAFVDYSSVAAVQDDAAGTPASSAYTEAQRALSREVNAAAEALSQVAGIVLL